MPGAFGKPVGRSALESVRLVGHVERHLTQLFLVGACMVCAEEKLATTGEYGAHKRLSSATVTTVGNTEGTRLWGNDCVHFLPLLCLGVLLNVAGGSKIPDSHDLSEQ